MDCDKEYLNEIAEFSACVPTKCGRFVTDSLVNESEVNLLLDLAKYGLSYGGGSGGASILDLHSGALSQGDSFVNIYKLADAKEFLDENSLTTYKVRCSNDLKWHKFIIKLFWADVFFFFCFNFQIIRIKIAKAISDKFGIDFNSIYLTHPTFFSRIDNRTAKTVHDEYWHPHVDKETYSSFHYTSLLYLNEYQRDFQGGRFIFIDENKVDNVTTRSSIEPKKGRVSVFTSGAENLHHIEKVTSGTRFVMNNYNLFH